MIPLNQLAFPSDWLVLRIVKKDVACRHLRLKKRHRHSTWACTPEAEFTDNENCTPDRC
jgi:hypothetical protein